jgi:hypothetical protein
MRALVLPIQALEIFLHADPQLEGASGQSGARHDLEAESVTLAASFATSDASASAHGKALKLLGPTRRG